MTVSRHIAADHDETIWVEFMWFDEQHHLHTGKAFPDALKVRTATPGD
ncbi:MAG: hypothetical protein ACYTCN_08415 [Planctomycetota bacterium]